MTTFIKATIKTEDKTVALAHASYANLEEKIRALSPPGSHPPSVRAFASPSGQIFRGTVIKMNQADEDSGEPLYWSNDDGVVSLECASVFLVASSGEKEQLAPEDELQKGLHLPAGHAGLQLTEDASIEVYLARRPKNTPIFGTPVAPNHPRRANEVYGRMRLHDGEEITVLNPVEEDVVRTMLAETPEGAIPKQASFTLMTDTSAIPFELAAVRLNRAHSVTGEPLFMSSTGPATLENATPVLCEKNDLGRTAWAHTRFRHVNDVQSIETYASMREEVLAARKKATPEPLPLGTDSLAQVILDPSDDQSPSLREAIAQYYSAAAAAPKDPADREKWTARKTQTALREISDAASALAVDADARIACRPSRAEAQDTINKFFAAEFGEVPPYHIEKDGDARLNEISTWVFWINESDEASHLDALGKVHWKGSSWTPATENTTPQKPHIKP